MSEIEGTEDERTAASADAREDLELNDEAAETVRGGDFINAWPSKTSGPSLPDPPPAQK